MLVEYIVLYCSSGVSVLYNFDELNSTTCPSLLMLVASAFHFEVWYIFEGYGTFLLLSALSCVYNE